MTKMWLTTIILNHVLLALLIRFGSKRLWWLWLYQSATILATYVNLYARFVLDQSIDPLDTIWWWMALVQFVSETGMAAILIREGLAAECCDMAFIAACIPALLSTKHLWLTMVEFRLWLQFDHADAYRVMLERRHWNAALIPALCMYVYYFSKRNRALEKKHVRTRKEPRTAKGAETVYAPWHRAH